ncbi:MAG: SNF2-related protein [Myxococcota bacterium]
MVLTVDIESLRTRKLKKQVGQKTFTRGCQYFASGRVVDTKREDDGWIVGTVTGSARDNYTVRIFLSQKDATIVKSECTCPYKHSICKHKVALALAALADPTLRGAESAGWGRILDDAEEVAQEFVTAPDEAEDRLVVRVDLPLTPDDVMRVRLTRSTFTKRGRGQERPIVAAQVREALFQNPNALGFKRSDETIAARIAGLLEEDEDDPNLLVADNGNLDMFLRAASRVQEVFIGDTDRRLQIKLEPVRPRVRVDSLKNQGLSLKVQIIVNGKRKTLDKRVRVAGEPNASWLFDGENTLMPMAGGAGVGTITYGLSRRQARMPLREVPTFLERGLRRMRDIIKVEADPGVLPEVTQPEPLLILGEDGESLKVQLSFRYGDPVELQVMSSSSPEVLRAPDGHEPPFVMRDLEMEKRLIDLAKAEGLPLDGPGTLLLDTPTALNFLDEHLAKLETDWVVLGRERLLRFRTKHVTPRLQGRIRTGLDWFDVNLEIGVEDSRYGIDALLQLYQSKRRYITLESGALALLPDAWVTHHLQVAMELPQLLMMGGIGRVPRYHASVLDALVGDSQFIDADDEWKKLSARLRRSVGVGEEPLPPGLKAELRPYQKSGYDWLAFLRDFGFHGILADDMGLGKTLQALVWLLAEHATPASETAGPRAENPSLVICPTSVSSNWVAEAARFTPGLKVVELKGANRDKLYDKIKDSHLVVTTYALLRQDLQRLQRRTWHAVILDEAQNIKNPESQTAVSAKKLKSKHRFALTGTPLENNLLELWSVFDFLMPDFLDAKATFRSRYVISGSETPEDIRGLRIKIKPFMLRRVKDEVARELPPKTEQTIRIPLAPEQQELYDKVRALAKQKVYATIQEKGVNGSTLAILDALLKLRQVACHPKLVDLDIAKGIEASSKHEALHDLIEEAVQEGHRALIFSQFTSHLAILKEWLDQNDIGYFYLDGKTRNRQDLIDAYNSPDGPPLFLISLKAGGTGLNLTAADYVIHMDPWWNPAVENQATDRAHRIGQTKPVFVYRLVAENTVEEKVVELQEKKKELFDSVVSADGVAAPMLSMDDLRAIFDD